MSGMHWTLRRRPLLDCSSKQRQVMKPNIITGKLEKGFFPSCDLRLFSCVCPSLCVLTLTISSHSPPPPPPPPMYPLWYLTSLCARETSQ